MISKKNIIYFSTLFFLYRFLIIYFNFNELRVPEYSNLQLEALNNNFLETFWFYSSLPLGNFLIIKISSYFSHIMDLKYLFYILNSMYNFFSIILFSKILLKPLLKKIIPIWNERVWLEDLPIKLRRQKILDLNFKDFKGLPLNIKDRNLNNPIKFKLPITRPRKSTRDKHPLSEKF